MAFTYWIDSSCTGDRDMDAAVTETTYFGEATHRRLNSASDTDFQHVYEVVMKRKKDTNDATFKAISGYMEDVSKMTLETNRNVANIRIYCGDKETRWSERTDPATGRNLGGWEDKDNWIHYPTIIRPGCLLTRGGSKVSYAETFREYMEGEPLERQADVRATISICDKSFIGFDGRRIRGTLFSAYNPQADLSQPKYGIDSFGSHLSKILLHELSHTKPYVTVDHGSTYGWSRNGFGGKTIQDLSTKELETHADVRAILGQLAIVADRGFTLHRKPRDDAQEKEKKDYDQDTKLGRFHKYDNISKRTLRRLVARLARRYRSAEI
ncbi:hypothetical protein GQ44DRAFT_775468 [Phaeosphaeriaceae sp. PMI808]|nr:hypothetical protein GQ44DRAFT_775468 [Phaeosphaeriaceae sp. PMI808]